MIETLYPSIYITDSAKNQFKKIGGTIRYSLNSGGCSGVIGKWEKSEQEEDDIVLWEDGTDKFIIDNSTIGFLDNATIEYSSKNFMPSFKVSIPDRASCGCGESFII